MEIHSNTHNFRCGNLVISPQTGEIKGQTQSIRLGLVNMQVLLVLLKNQGQVITRTELFEQVWKNQIVSDDTLTRCISDLRTHLGKLSDHKNLIETLPKRGYRWVAEVSKESIETPETLSQKEPQKKLASLQKWRQFLGWGVLGLVLLLVLSTATLWIANQFIKTDMVRVALIPIKASQQQQSIADNLQAILQNQLLATEKLRFLSSSAMDNRPQNPFPYLSHKFGTEWLIEGRVHEVQGRLRVSLNLVDARTALVSHSLNQDIDDTPDSLEKFSEIFVDETLIILRLKSE